MDAKDVDAYQNAVLEFHRQRIRDELVLAEHAAGSVESAELERMAALGSLKTVDRITERITDKSIGFLQVLAIAITALSVWPAGEYVAAGGWIGGVPEASRNGLIVYLGVVALYLLKNLGIAWSSDHRTYADPKREFVYSFSTTRARAHRLMRCVRLTMVGIVSAAALASL